MDEKNVEGNDAESPFTVCVKKNKLNDTSSQVVVEEDNSVDHDNERSNKEGSSTDLQSALAETQAVANLPEHPNEATEHPTNPNEERVAQQNPPQIADRHLAGIRQLNEEHQLLLRHQPVEQRNEPMPQPNVANETEPFDPPTYASKNRRYISELLNAPIDPQSDSDYSQCDSLSSDQKVDSASHKEDTSDESDDASDCDSSISDSESNSEGHEVRLQTTNGIHTIVLNFGQSSTSEFEETRRTPSDEQDTISLDSDDEFDSFRPVRRKSVTDEERHIDEPGPSRRNAIADNDTPPLRVVMQEAKCANDEYFSDDACEHIFPEEVLKERPKHSYCILTEVQKRELGLSQPLGKTTMEDIMFKRRFYSSLHAAYRMEKLYTLNKHKKSVYSLDFHAESPLLATGADDNNVIIWNWVTRKPVQNMVGFHGNRIYQAKFLYPNYGNGLDIVTSVRDGRVCLLQYSAAGNWSRRRLAFHTKPAVKVYVTPREPLSVLSAGQDGVILHSDLRTNIVNRVINVKDRGVAIPLQSVHGHPLNPMEVVVAPLDIFVRVYDRRKASKPVVLFCPTTLTEERDNVKKSVRQSKLNLTSAIYNHNGTEILASYSFDRIYLFDTKNDTYNSDSANNMEKNGYTHRYQGHRNSYPLKSVSFYGPQSQYILSGSDCGHFYMWEKETESIVQFRQADKHGVVNVVEPHPTYPILATCGMDKDVKIWAPYSSEDPTFQGLASTVSLNAAPEWQNRLFDDVLPELRRSWSDGHSLDMEDLPFPNSDANICTTI